MLGPQKAQVPVAVVISVLEHLLQQAGDRVAVEHECVHPSASCRSESLGLDALRLVPETSTSAVATASTNGVGPQT